MILFLFSLLFRQFSTTYLTEPPRKINDLEGFRSKKSMSSQTNWNKVQNLQGCAFKKISNITMILGITLIYNKYYIDYKLI